MGVTFSNLRLEAKISEIEKSLTKITRCPNTEVALQDGIAKCFEMAGLVFKREVSIKAGKLDFVIDSLIIEVKIKGSPLSVYRQLARYLEEDYEAAVLVTTKPFNLPLYQANYKPIFVINLWKNFL